jgi:putative protease
VESGADAVYLGLKSFSARALAENFSLGELRGAVAEARRRGVKVYVAANSLVKEGELRDAMALLFSAAREGVDAFIVQDLGVAELCRRFIPDIPLHASTLAAGHTPGGLAMLGGLGFARAVLPRESSFHEIEELSCQSPIDVEIFVHGASCFSFSGLCLFSSFLGGRSALRGACTQPCRRAYSNLGHRETFFSAADFEAAPFVRDLMRLPVAAYKIEGRMKGPDYVERAVKAYRLLIDSAAGDFEGALAEAKGLLDDAPQRRRSPGFVPGAPPAHVPGMFSGASASGVRLGRLEPRDGGWSAVALERPLKLHDRLRAVGAKGGEGVSFKLKAMRLSGGEGASGGGGTSGADGSSGVDGQDTLTEAPAGSEVEVYIGGKEGFSGAGVLYRTGSGSEEKARLNGATVKAILAAAKAPRKAPTVPRKLDEALCARGPRARPRQEKGMGSRLWYWLEDARDVRALAQLSPGRVILPLTAANSKEMNKRRLRGLVRCVWSLPPLLFGAEASKLRSLAGALVGKGYGEFMCATVSGAALVREAGGEEPLIYADHRMGFLNRFTADALYSLGVDAATVSAEIDSETWNRLLSSPFQGGTLCYLSGRPALFTSRLIPDIKRGAVESPRGERFWGARDGEAFVLLPEARIFMGGFLKGPELPNLMGYIVDLRREKDPYAAALSVRKAAIEGRRAAGSGFNFKRGLS